MSISWSKDHIYSADTEQQPIKVSLALKLFTLIATVRLSNKSHDGAGFLSGIDGVSEMTDDRVITQD